MHLGDACDCGKAVLKAASLPALLALEAITFSLGLLGFCMRPPGSLQLFSGSWGAVQASGAWGGVWGGGVQVRKQPQLEALTLGCWTEKKGEGRGRRKIKDELVNSWPWFTACCLLLYTILLFPYQMKGFDCCQVFGVLEDPGRGTTLLCEGCEHHEGGSWS